jgi:heavy-metal-associated domain-containing protein
LAHQIHHVPGRLRIRVPAVKRSSENAALLQGLLQAVPGVSAAEPNLTTGSIVVRYDPQSTNAALILAVLADRGYFQPIASPATPTSVRIRNKVATAVFWYCLEKAIERSVPLMLAALL